MGSFRKMNRGKSYVYALFAIVVVGTGLGGMTQTALVFEPGAGMATDRFGARKVAIFGGCFLVAGALLCVIVPSDASHMYPEKQEGGASGGIPSVGGQSSELCDGCSFDNAKSESEKPQIEAMWGVTEASRVENDASGKK